MWSAANCNPLNAAIPRQLLLAPPVPSAFPIIHFPLSNNCFSRRTERLAHLISAAPPHAAATTFHSDVEEDLPSSSAIIGEGWVEFSEKVSGEWDGFGADFTVLGEPIELPESVVPGAYREWEVKVFDWQTQCPTIAQFDENTPSLMYKTIKLLPTVGCEADAATRYSIEERNVTPAHDSPFAYRSNGCYVAVWPVVDQIGKSLEVEHCLIDPRDKESRVRIIQVLQSQDSELKLQSVKVFVEQWYGPFRNGDQLGGCAIRDSAFAATQPLDASQVAGVWKGLNTVATYDSSQNMIKQVKDECVRESVRNGGDLVLLPKQLWCSVKRTENGETFCEAGWLLDKGQAITSKCTFSSTRQLNEIAMGSETATWMQ